MAVTGILAGPAPGYRAEMDIWCDKNGLVWTFDDGSRLGHDRVMNQSDVEVLEAAVQALNDRKLEPFVGLMADDMVWTGQAPRWLWWRHVPS